MESGKIITIEGLKKHFSMGSGKFTALNGIDLSFDKGEFTGVIGPSGSGKTTLLNIMGSLDSPSEGKAIVLGKSVGDMGSKASAALRKSQLGFIFQSYNLLNVHNVFENVEFPLLLLGTESGKRKKMVLDALEWVGLTDKIKSRPAQLSGGECQRVAIARAMVKRPEIVLADEPTANLDHETGARILETMKRINKEHKTAFIFSTHDPKVMREAELTLTLEDGVIVAEGSPDHG